MGRIAAVISGKGGTGKTTLTAGIASCLAALGQRVLCIDADVGLRNLDISLGMSEGCSLPFSCVMRGENELSDAASHPEIPGLFLLTAPMNETPEALSSEAFGKMLADAAEQFDWVFLDAPAGIGAGFRLATAYADCVLVISNGDPASLRDAARAADLIFEKKDVEAYLVVNRVYPRLYAKMHATIDDVMDSVGLPLLGIVPEDPELTLAAAEQTAAILYETNGAAKAFLNISKRLLGRRVPLMKL